VQEDGSTVMFCWLHLGVNDAGLAKVRFLSLSWSKSIVDPNKVVAPSVAPNYRIGAVKFLTTNLCASIRRELITNSFHLSKRHVNVSLQRVRVAPSVNAWYIYLL
jgi:hypothetical protein